MMDELKKRRLTKSLRNWTQRPQAKQHRSVQMLPSKEDNAMITGDVLDKLKEQDIKRTVATAGKTLRAIER